MATTYEVEVGLMFEDDTSRKYVITTDSLPSIQNVKARIAELNGDSGTGAAYADDLKNTFVSDTGATVYKISNAAVIQTSEEVIYSG